MPDDNKVLNPGQSDPASSPGANPQVPDPANPPDPGANGTQNNQTPFHEVIKHPEFQPFLDKQIEEKVAARTAETVAKVLEQVGIVKNGVAPAPQEDANEEVKQLMAKMDIDEARARELISWRDKGIDKKTKTLEQRFDVLDLSMRFGQVFRENQDAKQHEGKMLEIFNGMNEFEKNFVMRSRDGANYLYGEAKKRSGILPAADRIAGGGGGSSSSRSAPVSDKLGDATAQMGQAVAALGKGNRAEYEKIMASVIRK